MLRSIRLSLIPISLFLAMPITASAGQWDPMINMALEQMKKNPDLGNISNCLGVSKSKFLEGFKNSLNICLNKHGVSESSEAAMDSCMSQHYTASLNISEQKMNECKEQYPGDEAYADDDDLAPDYSDMSDEEFEAMVAKEQGKAKAEIEQFASAAKSAAKGTESQIKLPVYKNSEILSHFPQGIGAGSLPVAMLKSSDSLDSVSSFYKKSLPNFQSKTYDGGMVIFMPTIPEGFEPLTDQKVYMSTPHISVYSSGDDVMIEIAYKN